MIEQFYYRDFLPLENLYSKKKETGRSISVVIPTFNEGSTIGDIVSTTKKELMDTIPLLDEIIVMDGGSDDDTAHNAGEAGADVYNIHETGRQDVPAGKGCALWKSLLVSKGDIIVCIDGDIRDFDVRFVYGLIAPLLNNVSLSFVKAFYQRPLVAGDVVLNNDGGRVSEILVRPLLSTFYPDLARLYQPLSGEYSFKREMISEIPIDSSYGLEIGLILNIYRTFGIRAFAQVDMDVRYHRNRSVKDLSKMAFSILHVFLKELKKDNKADFLSSLNTAMIFSDSFGWNEMAFDHGELPPIKECKGDMR